MYLTSRSRWFSDGHCSTEACSRRHSQKMPSRACARVSSPFPKDALSFVSGGLGRCSICQRSARIRGLTFCGTDTPPAPAVFEAEIICALRRQGSLTSFRTVQMPRRQEAASKLQKTAPNPRMNDDGGQDWRRFVGHRRVSAWTISSTTDLNTQTSGIPQSRGPWRVEQNHERTGCPPAAFSSQENLI
jgi:hypothetical protein